jgi:hypothetical protein
MHTIKLHAEHMHTQQIAGSVQCCDVSLYHASLAVVDTKGKVVVYNLSTKEVTFQETGATSVGKRNNSNNSVIELSCNS